MPKDQAASRGPRFLNDVPGLVAVLNNRADFERAESEHWYRIPEKTAPDGVEKIQWIAFYFTQTFGHEKWLVRYWAKVADIDRKQRANCCLLKPGIRERRIGTTALHSIAWKFGMSQFGAVAASFLFRRFAHRR